MFDVIAGRAQIIGAAASPILLKAKHIKNNSQQAWNKAIRIKKLLLEIQSMAVPATAPRLVSRTAATLDRKTDVVS